MPAKGSAGLGRQEGVCLPLQKVLALLFFLPFWKFQALAEGSIVDSDGEHTTESVAVTTASMAERPGLAELDICDDVIEATGEWGFIVVN